MNAITPIEAALPADLLTQAIALVRPQLHRSKPLKGRVEIYWSAVVAAVELGAVDVVREAFWDLAKESGLAADLKQHADLYHSDKTLEHVTRWALLRRNPFRREQLDPLEKFKADFPRLRSEAHQPKAEKADDKPRAKRNANGPAAGKPAPAQNSLREFGDSLPGDEFDDGVPFGDTEPRPIGDPPIGKQVAAGPLGEWDAGDDIKPPPRGWLLGNVFARNFISSLFAEGGTGKTALRYAQLLSLATGNSLTGEHVFQRCRVLIVSLEDDANELRRRILAAMLHHRIKRSELQGWLFLAAPGAAAGKLMQLDAKGRIQRGTLADVLESVVVNRRIDILSLDPFVKTHSVDENSNSAIDDVAQVLSDLAAKHNIAVDIPHHTRKGSADPGNAERGRGASATKDASRLTYTLTTMSAEEAKAFGIAEEERRVFIRMDSAKVNIAPPMGKAKWFRLVGVALGNATERYPHGDEVQTVELWKPPKLWDGLATATLNTALTEIDAGMTNGQRYTDAGGGKGDRAAWPVVQKHCPDRTEAQCREIIRTWLKNGVLLNEEYDDPVERKPRKGYRLDTSKRPT